MGNLTLIPKALKPAIKTMAKAVDTHSPTAFIIFGIGAMGFACYEAAQAAKEEGRLPKEADRLDHMKPYAKPTIIFIAGAASCIWGHRITLKRAAMAACAYSMADNALKEYKDAVKKEVGEKKEAEISDNVIRNYIREDCLDLGGVYDTKRGNTLFIETITKRMFLSSMNDIQRAVNVLNASKNSGLDVTFNDFEYEIGLPLSGAGKGLVWSDSMDPIAIRYVPQKTHDGQRAALGLSYEPAPKWSLYYDEDAEYATAY